MHDCMENLGCSCKATYCYQYIIVAHSIVTYDYLAPSTPTLSVMHDCMENVGCSCKATYCYQYIIVAHSIVTYDYLAPSTPTLSVMHDCMENVGCSCKATYCYQYIIVAHSIINICDSQECRAWLATDYKTYPLGKGMNEHDYSGTSMNILMRFHCTLGVVHSVVFHSLCLEQKGRFRPRKTLSKPQTSK